MVDANEIAGGMMESGKCQRMDGGKPRVDLIPIRPLFALARVYESGMAKGYPLHNWRNGGTWSRAGIASALRHLYKFIRGEDLDPETGCPHVMHCVFWLFALYEWGFTHPEDDDRYKEEMPDANRLKTSVQ